MIPKRIIEKAIERGWEPAVDFYMEYPSQWVQADDCSMVFIGQSGKIFGIYEIEKIVLDPSFWQALGKALGWRDSNDRKGGEWLLHAKTFHDFILTGVDTYEFWKDLLPIKK